jgi:hypothetical protein
LLFSKSSFITGQTIVIDGGFTLTKWVKKSKIFI